MPRIPKIDPAEAMRLLFDGYSARRVGEALGVDHGTVQSVKKKFLERAEEVSLLTAAKEYGVEEQVENLIKLGGRISKAGLEWKNVEDGVDIAEALRSLDVKPKAVTQFINEVVMESEKQKLDPPLLVKTVHEMYLNQDTTGKTYREQAAESTELTQKIMDDTGRLGKLEAEKQKLDSDKAYAAHHLTTVVFSLFSTVFLRRLRIVFSTDSGVFLRYVPN